MTIESLKAQRTKHSVQALDHIKEEAEGGCIPKGVKGSGAHLFHGVHVLKGHRSKGSWILHETCHQTF